MSVSIRNFVLVSFLLVGLAGPVAATSNASIHLSDTTPEQGDLVRLTIERSKCKPSVYWNDEPVPLNKRESSWIGYLGVSLEAEPRTARVRLQENCRSGVLPEYLTLSIRDGNFPVQRLTVPDNDKVELSEKDLRRHQRESKRIDTVLDRRTSERFWEPPFHPPVGESRFEPGNSFGSRRVINGHRRSPHSGEDYSASVGDPIYAINHGRVVLTGEFFFSGRGIFIDHGQGLFSMYFHLSQIHVEEGDRVRRGSRIGLAGASGRVTGPHLHLGVQLGQARVDPDKLFFEQSQLFRPETR